MTGIVSEADADLLLRRVFQSLAHDAMARRRAENDAILKELLGRWVSELEPTIWVGAHDLITGLGYGERIYVWRSEQERQHRLARILTAPVF